MAEVREGQVFSQSMGAGAVRLSGAHRTGRYGTQRKPFYLTQEVWKPRGSSFQQQS